jgi:uncharacterized membrane protein
MEENAKVTGSEKFMGVLAYLGVLVLFPLFLAKDSQFARYHTNQGLILFIAYLILGVLQKIFSTGIISTILWICGVIVFVFTIIGIVNVCKGECKELPWIGKYRILK